ncbi:MAG: cytochrome c [Thiomicrorhabdus sp.]|nr:MAG: cytochrome c [Thiomicrorhabdus sp.]
MNKLIAVLFFMSLAFNVQADGAGSEVYEQYCSACHEQGVFGAPIVGNREDWTQRISKGISILTHNANMGYVGEKGVMPAKGGHLNLSDNKVKEVVEYMIDQSW